ncbi:MAG: hypothetical protein ABI679_04650 [Gemmatimonadota bacterium]
MNAQIRPWFAALAVTVIVGGGCKKKEPPPPAVDTTAMAPAPAPVQVTSLDIGKSIGSDMKVTTQTTEFGTRDTIYAAVATSGTGTGNLAARWTFQDGQVVDSSSRSIAPTGDAITEFHISKPSRWPAGSYSIEILLNGQSVQKKDFTVK